MICHVYKRTRKKNGKSVKDRYYRGRYRLDGDYAMSEVALETADKQVAEQKLREIVREKEMERSGLIAPKLERESASRPLLDHLAEFIGDLKIKGRASRYCQGVNNSITRLLEECKWSIPKDIQANDFIQWRSQQTMAPKTLNEYLNAINTFLNWMVKQERISLNPIKNTDKVDIRGKQQKRRAVTDEEFQKLLEVSQDYRLLYITAVYTGLRFGELLGLRWSDIKLHHQKPHIHVPAILTKNRTQAIVPLHPKLVKEFLNEQEEQPEDCFVFPQYTNSSRRFRRHRKEAGIETIDRSGRKLDFHSFRYTFATKLARQGISQRLTQELMRHSDPRLTANLYTDVSHLPTFEAVQNLDWIEVPSNEKSGTHIGTQKVVSEGHLLAQTGISYKASIKAAGSYETKGEAPMPYDMGDFKMVGTTGFEPATSSPPAKRATKLRQVPTSF